MSECEGSLQSNGDEWLVNITNIEPVAAEAEDGIIDEVGDSSVVMFEYHYACVLCGICRVEAYIQFLDVTVKLIDEKGGDVEAMMLAIDKSSMRWLGDGASCCYLVDRIDLFVKRRAVFDGKERITEGIVARGRMNKDWEQALDCDDGMFLSCPLLEAKVRLSERGCSRLSNIGCDIGRDPKQLCWISFDQIRGAFMFLANRG